MPNVSFSSIELGRAYSRQQLAELWDYRAYQAIARGVVTPSRHSFIILFVTREKQSSAQQYEDRLEGGRLYWEGPTDHFAEERILRARQSGDEIHLFYRDRHHSDFHYHGRLRVLEAVQRRGSPSTFIFDVDAESSGVRVPDLRDAEPMVGTARLWEQPLADLRQAAFTAATRNTPASTRVAKAHYRSDIIKVYVLRRAEGFCEGCGSPAPFLTRKKTPYLEPHHLLQRADDGPDHPRW